MKKCRSIIFEIYTILGVVVGGNGYIFNYLRNTEL